MQRYAVIGQPIAHSLSPDIHRAFAQQFQLQLEYQRYTVTNADCHPWVRAFFAAKGCGLNVTLPLKETVIALADIVHPRAKQAQAANTLWCDKAGIHADNTDGLGLLNDLKKLVTLPHKKLLILGAGGAARGIIGPLLEAGVHSVTIANRSADRARRLQQAFPTLKVVDWFAIRGAFDVIINATAIGATGIDFPLRTGEVSGNPFVYDLSYDLQAPTPFLHYCKTQGWTGNDGLGMLVAQAAESFYLWHGLRPVTAPVQKRLQAQSRP